MSCPLVSLGTGSAGGVGGDPQRDVPGPMPWAVATLSGVEAKPAAKVGSVSRTTVAVFALTSSTLPHQPSGGHDRLADGEPLLVVPLLMVRVFSKLEEPLSMTAAVTVGMDPTKGKLLEGEELLGGRLLRRSLHGLGLEAGDLAAQPLVLRTQ